MAQRSSKHSEVKTTIAGFDGGLNLYDGSSNISDNQLVDCRNFFYAEEGDELVTRPGVKLVSLVAIGHARLTVIVISTQGFGWRLAGSDSWRPSSETVVLEVGQYTVEFEPDPSYTPGNITFDLLEDTTLRVSYNVVVLDVYPESSEDCGCWASNDDVFNPTPEMWIGKSANPFFFSAFINFPVVLGENVNILEANIRLDAKELTYNRTAFADVKFVKATQALNPHTTAEARALVFPGNSVQWSLPENVWPWVSPDLSSIIQPIMSDPDYKNYGRIMAGILYNSSSTGVIRPHSYASTTNQSKRPRLHIKYVNNDA